jgi:FG-GAP-like repeat
MPIKFLGSDFQINIDDGGGSGLLGNQQLPQITTLTDGRFAVVYQSDFLGNSADEDIIEALFNADGTPSIALLGVYAPTGLQRAPAAAALPGGGYGVVLTDNHHANGTADANPFNITYVRVASNGIPMSVLAIADFDGTGHDNLFNPAIATLSTGRQVVVFEREFTASVDDDIHLNVVSADGQSTQFAANGPLIVSNSNDFQGNPAVAAIGNSALVVYEDATGTAKTSRYITARLFDGNVNNITGLPITVADHIGALQTPKVAALDDHRYVIVYTDQFDIWGKIYDASTNSLTPEFEIDRPGAFDSNEDIAATVDGGFIVTWDRQSTSDDVTARRYNSDGVAMGQQFTVNRLTDGPQEDPSVAVSGANAFFAWTDLQSRPGDTHPDSVRGQVMSLTTPPDFNDNGLSDILWRNDAGQLALWDMGNGGAISGSGYLTAGGSIVAPGANWSVAAISDFTGDGRADVLWRDSSGQTALWTMNGSAIVGSGSFTSGGSTVNPDTSWSIAGTGDFDGDGKSDVLWRNTAGQLALWLMNGSSIVGSSFVNDGSTPVNPDPSWSVAGIGDFDGDGKSDVLWRSAAGEVAIWEMNGSSLATSGDVTVGGTAPRPGPTWSIAGVGDFNADGSADILWRDGASNSLVVWLMNGTNIIGSGAVNVGGAAVSPDQGWRVVEIGDFNLDARADILWRDNDGSLAEWQLKGTSIISSFVPTAGGLNISPDGSWHTQAKPTNFA